MSSPSLLEQGYIIKQESYRVWKVISPKGKLYYVWKDDRKWVCTCPYYTTRPRVCKHIKFIRSYIEGESS